MKALSNSKDCENCGNAHKSKPVCFYENGWHCFSCGMSKVYDRGYSVTNSVTKLEIPNWPNANTNPAEFSLNTRLRLMKYGVQDSVAKKYKLMETDDEGLILPNVDEKGDLLSYQIRWYDPRRIQTFGGKTPAYTQPRGDTVVLVEDFLSYMRVNELCNAICLFGTKASHEILQYAIDNYRNILVWLDDDHTKEVNSEQISAQKLLTKLKFLIYNKQNSRGFTVLGSRIANIINKEPKELVDYEIRTIIEGACNGNND